MSSDEEAPTLYLIFYGISLALEFPRNVLKPLDPQTGKVIFDENIKSLLVFDAGELNFSTQVGFEFNASQNFDLPPSQTGNSGLTIEVVDLKFDFRADRYAHNTQIAPSHKRRGYRSSEAAIS